MGNKRVKSTVTCSLFLKRVNTFKLLLNLSKSQNNLMYVILPQTTQCDLAA